MEKRTRRIIQLLMRCFVENNPCVNISLCRTNLVRNRRGNGEPHESKHGQREITAHTKEEGKGTSLCHTLIK